MGFHICYGLKQILILQKKDVRIVNFQPRNSHTHTNIPIPIFKISS